MSRVSGLLFLLMFVINAGFIAWIALRAPSVLGPDETVEAIVAASLATTEGNFQIGITEELSRLHAEAPSFWFVARRPDGASVSFGEVPKDYGPIIMRLDKLIGFTATGDVNSPLTAKLADVETEAGPVRIVYGGKTMPGSVLANLIWILKVLYLPTTLIPFVIVAVAIPFIVDRAFKGLDDTAERAGRIDVNSPDMRLPDEGVVRELDPLVQAVNKALGRIEENMRLRQRFVIDAAHELRTPIAILQTRLDGLPQSDSKTGLLRDVLRLGGIAEQLLDIQRFGVILSPREVDLVEICRTVAADLAPLAVAAGYDLEFQADREEMWVRADPNSAERAVSNLVRNAVEHSGGEGTILVKVTKEGVVEVSDEGVGIAVDDIEKIFEPFYRARPRSTGAGLGLSLVRQIATAHGGIVTALPRSRGACFRFAIGPSAVYSTSVPPRIP